MANLSSAVEKAVEHLRGHYQNRINYDEFASTVGCPRRVLSAIFKRETGWTLQGFLYQARIEGAKALLLNSALPVGDIGFKVGFASEKTFFRIFRKLTEDTPMRFRQKALWVEAISILRKERRH